MPKMEKMFGGTTAESKWKKENAPHISDYNKKYYKTNRTNIQAKRKIQRATKRKTQHNDFLGF